MSGVKLRSLLSPRSSSLAALTLVCDAIGDAVCIVDASDKPLLGQLPSAELSDAIRVPVVHEGAAVGFVFGPAASASALAQLLAPLAARESESRALAAEVLHLYRE